MRDGGDWLSLAATLRRQRVAGSPERQARGRCERLGRLLVDCLNRRDAIRGELAHDVEPERRYVLEGRLRDAEREQDRIENDISQAVDRWQDLADDGENEDAA